MSENEQAKIIGANIERLLKLHDMKQNELAIILSVSESTVGKWVLGKSIPRMGKIQQIADYFHVQKSDVLNHLSHEFDPPHLHQQKTAEAVTFRRFLYFQITREITRSMHIFSHAQHAQKQPRIFV